MQLWVSLLARKNEFVCSMEIHNLEISVMWYTIYFLQLCLVPCSYCASSRVEAESWPERHRGTERDPIVAHRCESGKIVIFDPIVSAE